MSDEMRATPRPWERGEGHAFWSKDGKCYIGTLKVSGFRPDDEAFMFEAVNAYDTLAARVTELEREYAEAHDVFSNAEAEIASLKALVEEMYTSLTREGVNMDWMLKVEETLGIGK